MDGRLVDKVRSLNERKKKVVQRGVIISIFSASAIIILIYLMFIRINLLLNQEGTPFIFIFVLIFILGISEIYKPLKDEDYAFLRIIKALEIVENPHSSDDNLELARGYVFNASRYLAQFDSSGLRSWYRNGRTVERAFIINLRNRIAPAIAKRSLESNHLEQVALTFVLSSFDHMRATNILIEAELVEEPWLRVSFLSSSWQSINNLIHSNRVFLFVLVFIITILIGFISAIILHESPEDFFKKNYSGLLAFYGAIIGSMLAAPYLSRARDNA